jgi:tetratricopeptide (TPR) repeat protein
MMFARKLLLFIAITAVLSVFSQPVMSQDNPDLQRGIAEFRQENYEEALDGLLKARSAEPGSSQAAYYLGVTYKNLQDYREAKKHLTDAVNLTPEIKEAGMELADVLYHLGEYKDALDVLKAAEKSDVRPGQTAFLKGLVLLEMNENTAAIESFKKAKAASPGLVQAADYQIGLALIKEEKLDEASVRFNEVVVKDPNTDMAAFSSHFIEKIEKKKRERNPYHYYLGLHFQYDDNVVLEPSESGAAANITDDDDFREVVTFGLEYVPRERETLDVSAHYSFFLSNHNDLSSFDVMSHTLTVVPSYKISENATADLALSYNHTFVDYDEYLSTAAVSPTYTRSFGKDHTLQMYVSYKEKEFFDEPSDEHEDRDADQYSLNFNWFYFFSQDAGVLMPLMETFQLMFFSENKGYFNLLYRLYEDDTEGRNWQFIGNEGIATFLVPFTDKFKASFSGGVDYQDYMNVHTVFEKERRDIVYTFSTLLFYKFYKHANIQFLYLHRRDDSNIALYDYRRNVYSLGLEWRY